jgi:AAA ATPase domain
MVTGDSVNVAARLEQSAGPGQILASARTIRGARGFRFVEIGPLSVKGKELPLRAFEVLDVEPGRERETTTRTPMLGRRQEMELLQTLYRRMVTDDRPNLVTIYGEAGVGKSRLVEEFQSWAEALEHPPTVVQGRCLPYGEGVTYWPLAEILKRHAGVQDRDPPATAVEKIRADAATLFSAGDTDDPDRTAAALGVTVSLEDPSSPLRGMEPRQVRLEVASAWRAFFSALARTSPAIVIIQDLHWAGSAVLDLLEELTDQVDRAVLFLTSARRELTTARPDWGARSRNYSGFMLEPLGPEDSQRLLGFLVEAEQDDLPPSVRERILVRAGGNPFFLEQIVDHLIEKTHRGDGDGGSGTDALEAVEIPDNVQAVLAARIDLLEPLEKRVLRSSAVVGKEFWSGPVARLLEAEVAGGIDDVEEVLSSLENRGLVMARLSSAIEGQREYVFRHILTRDVAYESLPRRERQRAHTAVATWIEERAGERRGEYSDLLAHHYAQAYRFARDDGARNGDERERLKAEAFGYALSASRQAKAKLALSAAEGQAELALTLAPSALDRSEALEALGEASLLDSQGDRAWQCFKDAVDLRRDQDDPRSIAQLCAKALEVPTRLRGTMRTRPSRQEAAPYLELGLASAGEGDSEERARLLIAKAFWPGSLGEGRGTVEEEVEARTSGEQAAAMAMRLERPDLASAALDGVSQYFQDRGLYGPWMRLAEQRLELARSLTDRAELGDIYTTAAWCSYHIGRYREAERYAGLGLQATEGVATNWELYCRDWRAVARCRLGEWDAFRRDVAEIAELLGDRRDQPPGQASDHLGAAAFVHEVRGEGAEADRLLEVIRWLEEEEERPSAGLAVWKALFLARRGAFDEARAALDLPQTLWHGYARGIVLEARCEILAQQEAWEEAPGVLDASRAHAEEAELLALACYADRLDGLAARAAGDLERAIPLLDRAAVGFAELEAAWESARSALALAEVLHRAGSDDRAAERLRAARSTIEGLRAVRELQRVDVLADEIR